MLLVHIKGFGMKYSKHMKFKRVDDKIQNTVKNKPNSLLEIIQSNDIVICKEVIDEVNMLPNTMRTLENR